MTPSRVPYVCADWEHESKLVCPALDSHRENNCSLGNGRILLISQNHMLLVWIKNMTPGTMNSVTLPPEQWNVWHCVPSGAGCHAQLCPAFLGLLSQHHQCVQFRSEIDINNGQSGIHCQHTTLLPMTTTNSSRGLT